MFGDWQRHFEFAPVSYSSSGTARTRFRQGIQAKLENKFFYTSEVRLEIVLRLDVQTVLETDQTADVDNYAKGIIDGLKGPNGILFDDTQVQALTISWLDSYGRERTSFDVFISASPDDFLLKPVEFYEMRDGLWYPYSRQMWSNGRQEEQTDRGYHTSLLILDRLSVLKKEVRHSLRKAGMDRLRAFQQSLHLQTSTRGFHRSRIDTDFVMHAHKEWRNSVENWRHDHRDEIAQIDQVLSEMKEILEGRTSEQMA